MFIKTIHLHLADVFPIMQDDFSLYIAEFIIASIIKPSYEYLGWVLPKYPVVNKEHFAKFSMSKKEGKH